MSVGYIPFKQKVSIVPLTQSLNIENDCQCQDIYLKASIKNLANRGWLCAGYKVHPTNCVVGQSGYEATQSLLLYTMCWIACKNISGETSVLVLMV